MVSLVLRSGQTLSGPVPSKLRVKPVDICGFNDKETGVRFLATATVEVKMSFGNNSGMSVEEA